MTNVIAFLGALFFCANAFGQCDTISSVCDKHLTDEFISDGQSYWALVHDKEVAEFRTTLFGGNTYRIAACTGFSDGNLIFDVYDKERNLLFSSADHDNAPYWDFKVKNTLDCIIEARLDLSEVSSGCAVLLVGFKQ